MFPIFPTLHLRVETSIGTCKVNELVERSKILRAPHVEQQPHEETGSISIHRQEFIHPEHREDPSPRG